MKREAAPGAAPVGAVLLCAVTLAAAGCRPPSAVVTLTDEQQLAGDATSLLIGGETERVAQPLGEQSFPLQVTLTADEEGARVVFIDAVRDDAVTVARASGEVSFRRAGVTETELKLGRPCAGEDGAEGELDPRCDDGLFCNGPERCVAGVCRDAAPECPPSAVECVEVTCLEAARACAVETRNDRCGEDTYCDARSGCVAGLPCSAAAECDDGSICNGHEVCEDGRCRDGPPLVYDDDNPCTLDACTDEDARGDIHVPLADGTPCASIPDGVCIAGACVTSRCGDGVRDDERGEECDDGDDDGTDDCVPGCAVATCGDGYVHALLEACDDGNTEDGDGCRGDCQKVEACGDGVLDDGEECDDGPAGAGNPNDGCDACVRTGWTTSVRAGLIPDGGDPRAVTLGQVQGLTRAANGDLFITGDATPFVWSVTSTGRAVPLVGVSGTLSDAEALPNPTGFAAETELDRPARLAVSPSGVVYVTEEAIGRVRVRAVFPDGTTRVVAGGGQTDAADGTLALNARFTDVRCLVAEPDDALLVCTPFTVFRYLPSTGLLREVLGGQGGIVSAALDGEGGLFLGIGPARKVRWYNASGVLVATLGSGDFSCSVEPDVATAVCIRTPSGLARDGDRLLVADDGRHAVWEFDLVAGTGAPLLGTGTAGFTPDGVVPSTAAVTAPVAVTVDGDGSILFAEGGAAGLVRSLAPDGTLSTIVGGRPVDRTLPGPPLGSAASAPREIVELTDGRVLVWDALSRRIYSLSADHERVDVFAGDGTDDDRIADDALSQPIAECSGITELPTGDVAVADRGHGRVLLIAADGGVSLLIGRDADDVGEVLTPAAVAAEPGGTLLVSDSRAEGARLLRVTAPAGSSEELATGSLAATVASCPSGRLVWFVDGGLTVRDAAGTNPVELARLVVRDASCGVDDTVFALLNTRVLRFEETATDAWDSASWAGELIASFDAPPGFSRLDTTFAPTHAVALVDDGLLIADARRVWHAPTEGPVTVLAEQAFDDGDLSETWLGGIRAVHALPATATGAVGVFGGRPFVIATGRSGTLRLVHLDGATGGGVQTVAGYPWAAELGTTLFGERPPARFAPLLTRAAGVAYDPLSSPPRLFVSDRSRHVIFEVELTEPDRPSTWRLRLFAGAMDVPGFSDDGLSARQSRLSGPAGLAIDAPRRALYVAELGNHTVRRIDLGTELVSRVTGVPGAPGDAPDFVPPDDAPLNLPGALAVTDDGDLYVADTGNHRVRLLVRNSVGFFESRVVLGDGQAASGGDGRPARDVLVDTPRGLAVDRYGNLFVSSRVTLRVVTAGGDQLADGDDAVLTVYGAAPRDTFPEDFTSCLSGIAMSDDDRRVVFGDICRGLLLEAVRGPLSP